MNEFLRSIFPEGGEYTFFAIRLAAAFLILIVAIIALAVARRGLKRFGARANLSEHSLFLLRVVTQYGLLLLTLICILAVFEIKLGEIATALSAILALVAIGFVAVWSVLSNFLCTFGLLTFKPFSIGDEIEFPADSIKGKVVDLNFVFTTLQSGPNEFCRVPNNLFFQKMFKCRRGSSEVSLEQQLARKESVPLPETPESETKKPEH